MITPARWKRGLLCLALAVGLYPALRAQLTETPHTVPPGKILVEMDGLQLKFDRAGPAGNTYRAIGVASTIVSAGLTRDVDLQVGVDLYHRESYTLLGVRDSHSGLGDLFFRTKWTFWRNEKLGAAAALIPYVKVPTARDGIGNDAVEGGLIVPWAMEVGGGFVGGAMLQWDLVRNDADNGYDANWSLSGFMQRDLALGFSVYAESVLRATSTGLSKTYAELGVGATWQWSKRVQLDYELLRGFGTHASDWTHVFRVNWGW